MKIRTYSILGFAALLAVPAAAPLAQAQEKQRVGPPNNHMIYFQGAARGRAEFVATEMAFDVAPVKGAPYSAEAITETVQVLGDGNRIVHSSQSKVYRDSEGRSRREHSLNAIGPWVSAGEPEQIGSINDPVAGVHYILTPSEKSARKLPAPTLYISKDDGKTWSTDGKGDVVVLKREAEAGAAVGKGEKGDVIMFKREAGPGVPAAKGEKFERVIVEGGPGPEAVGGGARIAMVGPGAMGQGGRFRVEMADPKDAKTEDLGTRAIEGVDAQGTRTTVTIAAGEIGNERAIEIVSERWFSNELQAVVMSRHSDPRFGETTYRLANVSRAEPDKALFEVPSDYTVEDLDANTRFKVRREIEQKAVPARRNQ
jgi:hypothetical protein